jgi:glucose-1-phosphatase
MDGVEAVLFDLGGVLVGWEGVPGLVRLCGGRLGTEEARRFWIESPWVRRFEVGRCRPEEFAAGVVEELRLPCGPVEFLEAFASWDRGLFPGALDLLDDLAPRYLLACLSNNNEVHWPRLRDGGGLGARFRRRHLSHETGLFKPDRAAYDHVVADLGIAASRILFLDDNPENVRGAEAAGLRAREVRGVEGTRRLLVDLGLLGGR